MCCRPWGCREWDTTERLNNNMQLRVMQSEVTEQGDGRRQAPVGTWRSRTSRGCWEDGSRIWVHHWGRPMAILLKREMGRQEWYVLGPQSCQTLYNPMDSNPLGSSVHGILQARILEWVAISFSRESSQPRF